MDASRDVKKLNLFTLPLTGRSLIEASAGTGKTYSLTFIYLRLLLAIGQNCYKRPLKVDEILVVTFTKAATQELHSRIRKNIYQLRNMLLSQPFSQGIDGSEQNQDPIYAQLVELIPDRKKAIQLLNEAGQAMDKAAIYTIHSFCQRILTTHAFASGILFEQTLVADEQQLRLQVTQDFWRHYFTPLDKPLAQLILQYWQDPASLLTDIQPYLTSELDDVSRQEKPSANNLTATITDFYQHTSQQINALKQAWLAVCDELLPIITDSDVSKQSYNSRNLPNWLEKVTLWARSDTTHFTLPKELDKFSQATLIAKTKIGKQAPDHPIFIQIEQLLCTPLDLRSHILMTIVAIIRQGLANEKAERGEMGFDDLLERLNHALQATGNNVSQSQKLAHDIATQYPVAMIDEFQDTDPIQYQIFDRIYQNRQETGLLFIGDPKQAIYSFRGADIFTYIQAKQSTGQNNHYTMDTNWRSSCAMVKAVNNLFTQHDNPFIFSEIPFLAMHAADQNPDKGLMLANKRTEAVNAYLLPDDAVTVAEYQTQMACCCAEQIVTWLAGDALLIDQKAGKRITTPVTAADIAILVRTGSEADLIQQQLTLRGVKSVYLSDRNSVFSSIEAKELLCLLQAASMPENETALRAALMTRLLGLSMADIETIADDQNQWENLIEEFKQYQTVWSYYGVLVMLRRMMQTRQLAENILAHPKGERILTNLMHLGELLQAASYQLDSQNALIRWLTKQISQPDRNSENHEQRLESDENLVKIITIHKAKGLEFPLVWLPFIAQYRTTDTAFYHDKERDYRKTYAWQLTETIQQQIENERVAEDLRLLYVAMTRSVYHCSIGLAKLKKNNSAINYLLQNNVENIAQIGELIVLPSMTEQSYPISYYQPPVLPPQTLNAAIFRRKLNHDWRVTSYTGLQTYHELQPYSPIRLEDDDVIDHQEGLITESATLPTIDDNVSPVLVQYYDIYHFPKGRQVGLWLHKLLENIGIDELDHSQKMDDRCHEVITQLALTPEWQPVLMDWLQGALSTPLFPIPLSPIQQDSDQLLLSHVLRGKCLHELQFYLPIRQPISCATLDKLCKQYDELSRQCPALDFDTVQGMLKGFIDLIFEFKGRFYIVDYKSNWLGNSPEDYSEEAIRHAMCEHRYELQYQLYSLALQRFLKSRLPNYQYNQHFGGIYYLFLRGMPNKGIFYHRPDATFINQLDNLFAGNEFCE
ncbi:exodeoxyribonuclease V subunit beta [Orbaceae bacterium ESL0727]|nr:exodeoxyribonuclease V subunit beta [Orbaceae bacterium ESL0727]